MTDTVVVLTRKDIGTFLEEGGSGYWKADADRVKKCTYLVTAANANGSETKHTQENHGHAFLVGKVSDASLSRYDPQSGRLLIEISEYALGNFPYALGENQRNPVRYVDISELGIDPATLDWQKFPLDQVKEVDTTTPLTMDEAKKGLAKQLGVSPDCVEITIRA